MAYCGRITGWMRGMWCGMLCGMLCGLSYGLLRGLSRHLPYGWLNGKEFERTELSNRGKTRMVNGKTVLVKGSGSVGTAHL